MHLKAHMIKTNYGIEKINEKKGIPVYEGIQVLLPDDYKEGTILGDDAEYWQIYTHYRGMNSSSFNNIAFEIIDANVDEQINLYLSHKSNPSVEELNNRLSYDSNSELYFDEPDVTVEYDKKKMKLQLKYSGNLSKTAVGHNTAGQFYVHAMNSNDEIVCRSPKIKVLPSSLSEDDYLEILNDLIKIKEDLIIDKESKVSLTGKWGYRKEQIEECIRKITQPMQLINANPAQTLITEVTKVKRNDIKKYTARTLIDKVMFPPKKYLQYNSQKKSIDIYENQIIKYTLIQLRKKIKEYQDTEKLEGHHRINENNLEIAIFEEKRGLSAQEYLRECDKEIGKYQNEIINYFNHRNSSLPKVSPKATLNNGKINVSLVGGEERPIIILSIENGYWNLLIKNCKWKKEDTHFINQKELVFKTSNIMHVGIVIKLLENMGNSNACIEYNGFDNGHNDVLIYELKSDDLENTISSPTILLSIAKYFDSSQIHKKMDKVTEIKEKKEWLLKLIENQKFEKSTNITDWDGVSDAINKLLSLDFFFEVTSAEVKWRPTQIFANDPKYNAVWKKLTNLNKQLNYMQNYDELRKNYVQLAKTQDLYEYWCYFKMIHFLITEQNWRINQPEELIKQIDNFFLDKKNIAYEIKCTLVHSNRIGPEIILNVFYEHKIENELQLGKYLYPDYHLEFIINSSKYNVYADAKYKNYTEMNTANFQNEFTVNIRDVAIDKYIKHFANAVNQATASFIIHPDINSEYTFFGGLLTHKEKEIYRYSDAPKHKFGAFVLLPSQGLYIKLFFRMIMEYHMGLYEYCWNCGETEDIQREEKVLESKLKKYHYHCNKCGDFWVKTHCRQSKGQHKLIKHSTNYHSEDEARKGTWYVQCPDCRVQ